MIIRFIYLIHSLISGYSCSSLLGRRNGAFWAVLIHFVKDDDDIGRVSGSNLGLQKSEVDEYILPSCIKLGSKLMEQDKSKKNDIIDEFGFGIYGCRRRSRYRSSCCGYRIHG